MTGKLLQFRAVAKQHPMLTEEFLEREFWKNIAQDISDILGLYMTSKEFIDNVSAHKYTNLLNGFRRMQISYPSTYTPDLRRAYLFAQLGKTEKCEEEFEEEKVKWLDEMVGANDSEFERAVMSAVLLSGDGLIERFLQDWLYNEHGFEDMQRNIVQFSRAYVVDSITGMMQQQSQMDGAHLRFTVESGTGKRMTDKIDPIKNQKRRQTPEGALLRLPTLNKS